MVAGVGTSVAAKSNVVFVFDPKDPKALQNAKEAIGLLLNNAQNSLSSDTFTKSGSSEGSGLLSTAADLATNLIPGAGIAKAALDVVEKVPVVGDIFKGAKKLLGGL
ncbi:MAG: hypothetical protein WCG23_04730 [bacterium]